MQATDLAPQPEDLFTINAGRLQRPPPTPLPADPDSQRTLVPLHGRLPDGGQGHLGLPPQAAARPLPTSSSGADGMALSGGYQRCVIPRGDRGDLDDEDRPAAGLRRLARDGLHDPRRVRLGPRRLPPAGPERGGRSGAPPPLPPTAGARCRLHRSWSDWLWQRGLWSERGGPPPVRGGLAAYRCNPDGESVAGRPLRGRGVGTS